ncbi:MAG: glutamate--cysteine ligase [Bdellovibrionales bacterium]|nr:glutamate--cysteine ligase [Bdellovibrionales bacterium]
MSREVSQAQSQILKTPSDLLQVFEKGARPASEFLIGIEFERFVIDAQKGTSLPFRSSGPCIEKLLAAFREKTNWDPVFDHDALISLTHGGSAITLEPGGQLEISAAAHAQLQDSLDEIKRIVVIFDEIGRELPCFYARTAVPPVTTLENAQWVPKSRYKAMRQFHQKDEAFLEMMTVTSSIQINYDYFSEGDCKSKIIASSFLSPILAALFANSFFENGKVNGFCTRRMQIWDRLDPNRSGVPPFFIDGTFTFEKYRDYMMDIPMYFISRDGKYIDVGHLTFREYMNTKPFGDVLEQDWLLHLTTTFPEVRLKNHLEFRSIDSNTLDLVMSSAAIIKGIMYHPQSLDQILQMCKDVTASDIKKATKDVSVQGMQASFAGRKVKDYVAEIFQIAKSGLVNDEQRFLSYVRPYVDEGLSPAEVKLKNLSLADDMVWKQF